MKYVLYSKAPLISLSNESHKPIMASMYNGGVTSQDRRQILGVCRGEEFLIRNSLEKRSEKRPFVVAELTLSSSVT